MTEDFIASVLQTYIDIYHHCILIYKHIRLFLRHRECKLHHSDICDQNKGFSLRRNQNQGVNY